MEPIKTGPQTPITAAAGIPEQVRVALTTAGQTAKRAFHVVDEAILAPPARVICRAMPNSFLPYAFGVVVPALAFVGAMCTDPLWASAPAAWLAGLGMRTSFESYNTELYWPNS